MCVLQDFEAVTPNLLARTIETVEGGGLIVLLLKTMTSLRQLYTMTMVRTIYNLHSFLAKPITGRTLPLSNIIPRLRRRPVQRTLHSLPWRLRRLHCSRRRAQRTPYLEGERHQTTGRRAKGEV